MGHFQALLVDVDGSAVDCEGRNRRVIENTAKKHGGIIVPGDWLTLAGTGDEIIHGWLSRQFSSFTVPVKVFVDEIKEGYLTDNFGVRARPGMADVLNHALDRRLHVVAVTNSPREIAVSNLRMAAIDHLFQGIVSRTEVLEKGLKTKPSGDPYRLAANDLGVPFGACLVLEDSGTGTAAGIDAGMQVVQILDDPAARSNLATYHVDDEHKLRALVKRLIP